MFNSNSFENDVEKSNSYFDIPFQHNYKITDFISPYRSRIINFIYSKIPKIFSNLTRIVSWKGFSNVRASFDGHLLTTWIEIDAEQNNGILGNYLKWVTLDDWDHFFWTKISCWKKVIPD